MATATINVDVRVAPIFEDYIFDWYYEEYVAIGGYGSAKSHSTAIKLILKLLQEKRKCLVIREIYGSHEESTVALISEILTNWNILSDDPYRKESNKHMVLQKKAPHRFIFPNGSEFIFRGLDNPNKLKSIHGVSIVWVEESSEITKAAYLELIGRLRVYNQTMHRILTTNPISRSNWMYKHFFKDTDENGKVKVLLEEDRLYQERTLVNNGTYFHHSVPDDNPWLPDSYIRSLDKLKDYDSHLYMVARQGKFGATGTRVLPQLHNANKQASRYFVESVRRIPDEDHYFGMDFGFEESYNAVLSMAIDKRKQYLYIYDEIYINKITDDKMAIHPKMLKLKDKLKELEDKGVDKYIAADNADPKAIQYYQNQGYKMRGTYAKFIGSRLSNTRKVKRFKKIYVSPKCVNTLRELEDLSYKVKRNGDLIYDDFNIDPHTFSAIWYGLDLVNIVDLKDRSYNHREGSIV